MPYSYHAFDPDDSGECADQYGVLTCGQPADAPVHKVASEPSSAEPPARVWIQLRPMPPSELVGIASYHERPGDDDRGNGTPFYEYAHLAPIRAAIEACEATISEDGPSDSEWVTFGRIKVDIETETETFERATDNRYTRVRKSDWDALVATITSPLPESEGELR
jgi:hypothetical protein